MNKKEWKIEVIVKSVPHLELVPENIMEAFVTGMIESIENLKKLMVVEADKYKKD